MMPCLPSAAGDCHDSRTLVEFRATTWNCSGALVGAEMNIQNEIHVHIHLDYNL